MRDDGVYRNNLNHPTGRKTAAADNSSRLVSKRSNKQKATSGRSNNDRSQRSQIEREKRQLEEM